MDLVQFAQQLKRQTAIEQLVADYVPSLRRAGASYKGLCPFHDEKTPSFFVHPEHGRFKCFGCGASGDAITFIQEYEKVDFSLAIETLARRFSIEIPDLAHARSKEDRDRSAERRRVLLAVCRLAEEFFIQRLAHHPEAALAREYLASRGLTPEQIVRYRIGFAPPGYETLLTEAERRGYRPETLAEAGLALDSKRGGYIDRFRGRIIFPIADKAGDTVGFGARALGEEQPKYLNSPDTVLFHKGRLLYGLAEARLAIRETGRVIVLEGYMDWIALHSQGIGNVVAGLGTAFTGDQARLLRQLTNTETILHYDGDEAGRRAMFEAARLALGQELKVRVALLPSGHDPDSFIRAHGPGATRRLLDSAEPAIDCFFERALAEISPASPEGKLQIVELMAPLLLALRDPILAEGYLNRISARLGLQPGTLARALKKKAPRSRRMEAPKGEEGAAAQSDSVAGGSRRVERHLLYMLLRHVEHRELFDLLEPEIFESDDLRSIFSILQDVSKSIHEGGQRPEDWFTICNTEADKSAMDAVLFFEGELAQGQMPGPERKLSAAEAARECRIQASRLRRNRNRRLRSQAGFELRGVSGTFEEHREGLDAIHAHSAQVVSETDRILSGGASDPT